MHAWIDAQLILRDMHACMQAMLRLKRVHVADVVTSPNSREDMCARRGLAEAAKQTAAVACPQPPRRSRKDCRKDRRGVVALDPTPGSAGFVPHPPLSGGRPARKVHMSREQVAARERERGTMVGIVAV